MLEQASIIRENRKTVKITFNSFGKIEIYCPYGLSLNKINEILKSKEKIIEKKINSTNELNREYARIINYENIMFLGKEYLIVPTNKVNKTYFTDEYFLIPNKFDSKQKTLNCIRKSFKEIAEKVLISRLNKIVILSKNKPNRVVIGGFKSKWGSCDNFGVIKLNWKLIMLAPELIDFVLCHELTHLQELNHSNNFYKKLEKICPNYKKNREDLRKYGFLLELY